MSDRAHRLARASAWMALGTVASRLTGFLRVALLAWTIGTALDGDLFDGANTIPNTLYILVAGGLFNVVLVPQLVRAMKTDDDGGDAFAQRVITAGLLVLAVATVVLTLLAPLVVRVVFNEQLFEPGFADQRASAELLMYLCMPQVFFYGAFVLVGQVLNSRERFGPMMWAPVLNNVVACGVIVAYLLWFGAATGEGARDGFTTSEAVLLGVGSTAGIALQALVLLPYLRSTGFRFRLRFDLRDAGLARTMRLGVWTLGFIVANQVAFIVVNRLATRGTLDGAATDQAGGGSAVYAIGYLVSQLPHGVITVSLATALMPTLAAMAVDGAVDDLRIEIGRTLRLCLVVIAPLAVTVACLGPAAASAISIGALKDNHEVVGHTVAAFSVAMVTFTIHYLVLRGFYAMEDTRTPFAFQVVVAAVNVVLAVVLTRDADPDQVAPRLALAYGLAYVVGAGLTMTALSRRVGRLLDREMVLFVARLVVCCAAVAAVILLVVWLLGRGGIHPDTIAGGTCVTITAALPAAAAYVGIARLVGLEQLRYLTTSLRR